MTSSSSSSSTVTTKTELSKTSSSETIIYRPISTLLNLTKTNDKEKRMNIDNLKIEPCRLYRRVSLKKSINFDLCEKYARQVRNDFPIFTEEESDEEASLGKIDKTKFQSKKIEIKTEIETIVLSD